MSASQLTVGVLSDTHGLLRAEVTAVLRGSDLLIHAGDIGTPEVLDQLRELAPTFAVRGNVDTGRWAEALPRTEVVKAGPLCLYVLHELGQLDLDPAAAEFAAVISGHTHRPSAESREGVLYLNPGSAGPCRFGLPVAVARLIVLGTTIQHENVVLQM